MSARICSRITVNLYISLKRIDISIILSFLMYEDVMSLHLFRSSLICQQCFVVFNVQTLHIDGEIIPKYFILFGAIMNDSIFKLQFPHILFSLNCQQPNIKKQPSRDLFWMKGQAQENVFECITCICLYFHISF